MRTVYIEKRPPVPDNAFTRTVAVIGALSWLVAYVALVLIFGIFALGAVYGLVAL